MRADRLLGPTTLTTLVVAVVLAATFGGTAARHVVLVAGVAVTTAGLIVWLGWCVHQLGRLQQRWEDDVTAVVEAPPGPIVDHWARWEADLADPDPRGGTR